MPRKAYAQGHVHFSSEKEKRSVYAWCRGQGASFSHITRMLLLRAKREGWKLEIGRKG
jgi:hypothetical protein